MVEKKENTEKTNQVVEKLKKELDLEPVLTKKFGSKLQAHAKWVYYGLLILTFIFAIATWATMGFSAFLIQAIVYFTLVRLFAEDLANK